MKMRVKKNKIAKEKLSKQNKSKLKFLNKYQKKGKKKIMRENKSCRYTIMSIFQAFKQSWNPTNKTYSQN